MKKSIIRSLAVLTCAAGFSSCSDFFNPDSSSILQEEDYIGSTTEVYSGYFGLASLVQEVADKAVFLEGLRGEFLEPTENGTQEMWDIYNYQDHRGASLQGNTLANPEGYYKIINNANDFLAHLKEFEAKNPNVLSSSDYAGIGGGAVRFKVWAYMMLAKIYGEARIIDEPITSYVDITKYDVVEFDAIFDQCLSWMTVGDFGYLGVNSVRWSQNEAWFESITGSESVDMLQWNRVTPAPQALLAEIYLWKNQYQACLDQCVSLITEGSTEDSYMLTNSEWNGEWIQFGYQFVRREHICSVFYNYEQYQTNNIVRYFSNSSPNEYRLRPTQTSISRFEAQVLPTGSTGDTYRGLGRTYKKINGDYVAYKFLIANESATTVYRNDVMISLYRAADIYLFMLEALNNLGRFEEAQIFYCGGIGSYYDSNTGSFLGCMADKGYPTALYGTGKSPCMGLRGRVSLGAVGTLSKYRLETLADSLEYKAMMDSAFVEEACVESAGESRGYYSMIRNARRYPERRALWAAQIASKYTDGSAVLHLLETDEKNWFIKYDLD